jgi:N-acetylmuramic acid 6-phosphate etherase
MVFTKITEQDSLHNNLEQKSVQQLLQGIHQEDQKVIGAVELVLPEIEILISSVVAQLQKGGRLFYIGAGTSGRLGILDASECPPTFGSDPDQVIGVIAGGKTAVYKAVENAEDNINQGWIDLQGYGISSNDMVIGIAASGTTPYVIEALRNAQDDQIPTGSICCNPNSPLSAVSDFPIEVIVGTEFVTGSSRMKAGTAQKLILNMISTATMIQLGHIRGNKMVDMQMTNEKLKKRAIKIVQEQLLISKKEAKALILKHKSIRIALDQYTSNEQRKDFKRV